MFAPFASPKDSKRKEKKIRRLCLLRLILSVQNQVSGAHYPLAQPLSYTLLSLHLSISALCLSKSWMKNSPGKLSQSSTPHPPPKAPQPSPLSCC